MGADACWSLVSCIAAILILWSLRNWVNSDLELRMPSVLNCRISWFATEVELEIGAVGGLGRGGWVGCDCRPRGRAGESSPGLAPSGAKARQPGQLQLRRLSLVRYRSPAQEIWYASPQPMHRKGVGLLRDLAIVPEQCLHFGLGLGTGTGKGGDGGLGGLAGDGGGARSRQGGGGGGPAGRRTGGSGG